MSSWSMGRVLGALGLFMGAHLAFAQTLVEQNAAMSIAGTLDSQQVGSASGNGYIDRARNAADGSGTALGMAIAPPVAPMGPGGMPGGMPGGLPGPYMGQEQFQNAVQGAQTGVQNAVAQVAKIQVIAGSRVYDAITGELLDDAVEQQVPATEKNQYFDDGTHGDVEANDGKYTKVDERKDVIGQSNHRIKERLVQALLTAEGLNPLEFYGFSLMSTERTDEVSRGRVWSIVKDPKGGPGYALAEVPISEAKAVPKYRKFQAEKDQKVKEDWAQRFLQIYRVNQDSLTSEYYALYVPQPPPMPFVNPPETTTWQPFSDPMAGKELIGGATSFAGGGPMGAGMMGGGSLAGAVGARAPGSGRRGVTGSPSGSASSRYF